MIRRALAYDVNSSLRKSANDRQGLNNLDPREEKDENDEKIEGCTINNDDDDTHEKRRRREF